MITEHEDRFGKSYGIFCQLCQLVTQAEKDGQRVDQVERKLFTDAQRLCLQLLTEFITGRGTGDVGPTLAGPEGEQKLLPEKHDKRYLSIFGEIRIARSVYGTREGQALVAPLDKTLGLPAGENSYVLEDWLQRLCVKEAFGSAVDDFYAWLGIRVSVRTAEHMNRELGAYVDSFRLAGGDVPPAAEEEELLVATGDGKGVVMRRTLEERLQADREAAAARCRPDALPKTATATEPSAEASTVATAATAERSACDVKKAARKTRQRRQRKLTQARQPAAPKSKTPAKDGRKQMGYVGAVYTIARFRRSTEEVVNEVRRHARSTERPKPQHKHVWAEMTRIVEGEVYGAAPLMFLGLAVECHQRDPDRRKTLICLFDGERQLWDLREQWFERSVGILDLYHALERLWSVGQIVQGSGTAAASEFVTHHLRMLLDGKVGYVIRNFRRALSRPGQKLSREQRETVQSAIGYYENNREHMRYDEYLAAGYPIATGVAEGTCKHLVKDRMELAGMRWELEGAQAMLATRAVYVNDQWDAFITHRIQHEQTQLYGQPALAA